MKTFRFVNAHLTASNKQGRIIANQNAANKIIALERQLNVWHIDIIFWQVDIIRKIVLSDIYVDFSDVESTFQMWDIMLTCQIIVLMFMALSCQEYVLRVILQYMNKWQVNIKIWQDDKKIWQVNI